MSRVIIARWPGTCAACDYRWAEGDPIRHTDDGYIHDDCREPEPVADVCPRCWLARSVSGTCGCDEP